MQESSSFQAFNRRCLLKNSAVGFGYLALSAMLQEREAIAKSTTDIAPFHFAPRAKRVIFLFMMGGPSQVDTFDYKPLLQEHHELIDCIRAQDADGAAAVVARHVEGGGQQRQGQGVALDFAAGGLQFPVIGGNGGLAGPVGALPV